jgi:hypothetical protein
MLLYHTLLHHIWLLYHILLNHIFLVYNMLYYILRYIIGIYNTLQSTQRVLYNEKKCYITSKIKNGYVT